MNKNLIILVVIIVLIALGVWYWNSSLYQPSTTATAPTTEDTTTAIDADLSNINVESGDQDFKDIDTDLQTL
ncbi:MAG: hypothetical protein AAB796_03070 [Patescibacteria group bacterium]